MDLREYIREREACDLEFKAARQASSKKYGPLIERGEIEKVFKLLDEEDEPQRVD